MRISTSQLYTDSTRNMLEGQSKLADVQSKISSGKNFTTLAEDPVAANQVVNLKRELAQFDVFATNIDATSRRLDLEETTLDQISNAVTRSRELVIQAANGTLTDADRIAISYELEELVEFAASLMNTRDAKGEYIFSGSKGTTQTYIKNDDGSYTYQGDDTRRQIQVGSTQYLESTDTGQYLFEAVPGLPEIQVLGEGLNTALAGAVTNYEITDPVAFERFMRSTGDQKLSVTEGAGGTLYYSLRDSLGGLVLDTANQPIEMRPYTCSDPDQLSQTISVQGATLTLALPSKLTNVDPNLDLNDAEIAIGGEAAALVTNAVAAAPGTNDIGSFVDFYADQTNNPGPFTITATENSGALDYQLIDRNGDEVLDNSGPPGAPILSVSGDDLTFGGWTFTFNSADALAQLDVGESISFDLTLVESEAVTLRYEEPKTNILSTLSDVTEALRNSTTTDPAEKADLSAKLGLALDNLTAVQERFSQAVAGIGARLNTMDSARFSNEDFRLLTRETLSSIEDLDYASASTELAKRQLALEASYASFAKIQGLSLFNYIN